MAKQDCPNCPSTNTCEMKNLAGNPDFHCISDPSLTSEELDKARRDLDRALFALASPESEGVALAKLYLTELDHMASSGYGANHCTRAYLRELCKAVAERLWAYSDGSVFVYPDKPKFSVCFSDAPRLYGIKIYCEDLVVRVESSWNTDHTCRLLASYAVASESRKYLPEKSVVLEGPSRFEADTNVMARATADLLAAALREALSV